MNLSRGDTRLIIDVCKEHGLSLNQAAYVLATAWHESAHTMKPVRETLAKSDAQAKAILTKAWKSGRLKVKADYWSAGWFGRGYVQLTHKANYEQAGKKLGVDLVGNPSRAMEPVVSAQVLVRGMKEGWFTGKKLSDYIVGARTDFRNARRIVNGTDKADLIAGNARQYMVLLASSGYDRKTAAPAKTPAATPQKGALLKLGSTGEFVVDLQANLNTLGYGPIGVTGTFDDATEKAVKKFQTAARITVDGKAGTRTHEELGKALDKRETAPKLAAAEEVVEAAASEGKGMSKTEGMAILTTAGGTVAVVKDAVETAKEGATTLLSLGPWILLGLIIIGGGVFIVIDRRKKRLAARKAQEAMR